MFDLHIILPTDRNSWLYSENVKWLQAMENGVYDKVAEYLMLIGRTELLTCSATQTSFTRIRDQAQQVSGVSQLFLTMFDEALTHCLKTRLIVTLKGTINNVYLTCSCTVSFLCQIHLWQVSQVLTLCVSVTE